jgi:hypothetical protein
VGKQCKHPRLLEGDAGEEAARPDKLDATRPGEGPCLDKRARRWADRLGAEAVRGGRQSWAKGAPQRREQALVSGA